MLGESCRDHDTCRITGGKKESREHCGGRWIDVVCESTSGAEKRIL
ncbi:hypothetical protein AALP_AA6G311500 [Arabis alpina]|uniref:Uncharacterized protein n=1 Tax=Arabis alpina TaxID=50452 RepID=A0A087GSV4_ARAAL|nr:hypothetical protein AALP_AA6G311500 [Arabis alpina]